MTQLKPTIDEAFAAARALPMPAQEALAAEILARIGELERSVLTDAEWAEIEARLTAPAIYADSQSVRDFFAEHGAGG